MSGGVFKSLLCKNICCSLEILSSTTSFQIWSSGQFCTTTYLNVYLKLPPKLWDVNRSILFNFMQKDQLCPLKNLSESTSFSFWSNLMFCTATIFLLAPLPMILFPAYRPCCKTLKSKRVDPREDLKCMHSCLFLSIQN